MTQQDSHRYHKLRRRTEGQVAPTACSRPYMGRSASGSPRAAPICVDPSANQEEVADVTHGEEAEGLRLGTRIRVGGAQRW